MPTAPAVDRPPPLPVRGAASAGAGDGSGAARNGGDRAGADGSARAAAVVLPMLSAEQLAADQPSLDMLRRVRQGLRELPESG
ncbi:hypothetical protein ACLVWQ_08365 [Streptomyces sp. CWNU-52B]|uniref:hypothetical protein n=1 Tax=unclassified Streptomyces TaxID=2593676 RepID=UPI0039BFE293